MKKEILTAILLTLCVTSCSDRNVDSGKYVPEIGDTMELVYSKISVPYFGYEFGESSEIFGYLYLESEGRFSAFGPGMIDESNPDVQVFLILFENNIIKDKSQLE